MEYNVAVQLKVYLKDSSAEDKVKSAIEESGFAKLQNSEMVDIGFGIKALRLVVLLSDEEGGTDKLESSLKSIEEVGEVEVESVSRV